ncbi:MAG TPA: altronate hydrolase [Lentisphaeria bacterium]|nr:MAG: altronate hydrolase [Lentisphaerae bacterium GWF2_38_69]HBM15360.1 altronate hydrolase [Lentisphaeria bacterium]
MKSAIRINPKDNVAVALQGLESGQSVQIDDTSIIIKNSVKRGHKFAVTKILKGESIIKYSMPIGYALRDIEAGEHAHTHNIKTKLDALETYSYTPESVKNLTAAKERTIKVFKRNNAEIGIRNELWIIPTVGCTNAIGDQIINEFKKHVSLEAIDGVYIFKHPYGCSQLGEDHENTKVILQDMVKHPNAGGVLILGLGCENNQVSDFLETLGSYDKSRVKALVIQDVKDEVAEGVLLLNELFINMMLDKRVEVPISSLRVGLKCGGSDGFSGITANPLIGRFSDYLVAAGGTSVLTEVPEMFGAETILMNRAKDEATFKKIVTLINDFKNYFKRHGQTIYENPSPGNKEGGISTLEDKSMGCTQKAGSSKVVDVLNYGEKIKRQGLTLLYAPGNDLVASTALGAAGCHMVLFSTGRGTPYGTFVPTVKISTNTELFERKPNWIDFDSGCLLNNKNFEELTEEFIDYIVEAASGKYVNNEKNNFREIAIFKQGVTL